MPGTILQASKKVEKFTILHVRDGRDSDGRYLPHLLEHLGDSSANVRVAAALTLALVTERAESACSC